MSGRMQRPTKPNLTIVARWEGEGLYPTEMDSYCDDHVGKVDSASGEYFVTRHASSCPKTWCVVCNSGRVEAGMGMLSA